MKEIKDASTDIIVVSNELLCKEEMAKDFDKHFSRGCNIIEVTSLQPISIMQRIVYALLEKNSFVTRDADHIVFTLLSEYSRGAATVVYMLTSLMQKSEDNSRTGFELAKQQLKLHIAHRKAEKSYFTHTNVKIEGYCENIMTERESQITHVTSEKIQTNISGGSEIRTQANVENEVDRSTRTHNIVNTTADYVADSDDNERTAISDARQNISSLSHPLYMYINDILTSNISLPAHHLLNSLVMTGPIPLPLFYVEELNNVVMNAVINKDNDGLHEFVSESPMKRLVKVGVIRNACYPIVYHKELNPDCIDTTSQSMFIPKLICDAVKGQMDDVDRVLSILCIQRTLENLLTSKTKPSLIHLHYILNLCNQLDDVCTPESQQFGSELITSNLKLKLLILHAKAQRF